MKILWITNILFPDIAKAMKQKVPVTGGWMYSSAKSLLDYDESVELTVATFTDSKDLTKEKINGITYYCLPHKGMPIKYYRDFEANWLKIQNEINPDIVHIHGSEFSHGLAYINACGKKHVLVSIQGLVGAYARYSLGSISQSNLWRSLTISDIKSLNLLPLEKQKMLERGKMEAEYFKRLNHVIGRTSWDKTHVLALNSVINYHFCNETLRSSFYNKKWNIAKCEPHTIFLSQAAKPIKGIHMVIKALPLVLRRYPNTKVYVAGHDFVSGWRRSTYGKYILKLMRKYNVLSSFVFTGVLNEEEICERYLNSHVFVCPSAIENSPNSVGEAQLLGVPCIASYVGGTPDMVENNKTGLLYRFEEYEMLAECISKIFGDNELANTLSKNEQIAASKRHSVSNNSKTLFNIYNKIACDE